LIKSNLVPRTFSRLGGGDVKCPLFPPRPQARERALGTRLDRKKKKEKKLPESSMSKSPL